MVELPPLDLHGQIKRALEKMGPQMTAINDILDERRRQDAQWGVQNHHPAYWLAIVGKQVGQLGTAILDREWWTDQAAGTAKVRAEAVQGAAVLMALIECIDRGEMPIGLTTMPQGRQRAHALGVGDEAINYSKDDTGINDEDEIHD